MAHVLQQLVQAMNRHDAAGVAALFAPDYRSEQPVHPNRGFGGSDQVLENWTSVFEGVPDFSAELVAEAESGDTVWSEMHWHGTYRDGSPFRMRGVAVLGLRAELITWARLYLEPVEEGGGDIDAAVQQMYRPPGE